MILLEHDRKAYNLDMVEALWVEKGTHGISEDAMLVIQVAGNMIHMPITDSEAAAEWFEDPTLLYTFIQKWKRAWNGHDVLTMDILIERAKVARRADRPKVGLSGQE